MCGLLLSSSHCFGLLYKVLCSSGCRHLVSWFGSSRGEGSLCYSSFGGCLGELLVCWGCCLALESAAYARFFTSQSFTVQDASVQLAPIWREVITCWSSVIYDGIAFHHSIPLKERVAEATGCGFLGMLSLPIPAALAFLISFSNLSLCFSDVIIDLGYGFSICLLFDTRWSFMWIPYYLVITLLVFIQSRVTTKAAQDQRWLFFSASSSTTPSGLEPSFLKVMQEVQEL
jgi:hypothetical protein